MGAEDLMDENKLGIGIAGCGNVAGIHAEAIRASGKAALVAVFSRDLEKAQKLGEKFEVPAHNDWQEFIRSDGLEAVSICTPSGAHLDYGKLAAEAGKHVIAEKPIEVTLERGQRLIEVCHENKIKLAVIYQNRFLPEVMEMKARLAAGELGKIFLADARVKWYRGQEYYDSAAWRGTMALDGGGVLINQAIHTIDLLQWLAGKVETVSGQIGTFTHEGIEGEDTAVATLRFVNGALGVIEGSTSVRPATARRLEIHGEKGTAILDGNSLRFENGAVAQPATSVEQKTAASSGASSPLQNFSSEPHRKQFEAIAGAIEKDEAPPVSGEESLESLAIVLAIYESAKTGRPLRVAELMRSRIREKQNGSIIY
jgi:predicted dehydrogenase